MADFEVTFVDVGHGDATLIKTPGERYTLVDVVRCPGEGIDLFNAVRSPSGDQSRQRHSARDESHLVGTAAPICGRSRAIKVLLRP